jgi:hypothetical protein
MRRRATVQQRGDGESASSRDLGSALARAGDGIDGVRRQDRDDRDGGIASDQAVMTRAWSVVAVDRAGNTRQSTETWEFEFVDTPDLTPLAASIGSPSADGVIFGCGPPTSAGVAAVITGALDELRHAAERRVAGDRRARAVAAGGHRDAAGHFPAGHRGRTRPDGHRRRPGSRELVRWWRERHRPIALDMGGRRPAHVAPLPNAAPRRPGPYPDPRLACTSHHLRLRQAGMQALSTCAPPTAGLGAQRPCTVGTPRSPPVRARRNHLHLLALAQRSGEKRRLGA